MINALNAHGFVLGWSQIEATLKHKFKNTNMEIDDKIPVKHKLDYLKLTLKISKMRYHGEEPSIDLLFKAQQVGSLAKISDDELNNLLFNLDIPQ
ncbi:MAG: hypothetical protein PVJ41_09710 [Desulfobacterales bacterium]|jgi:hypothetical protein